MGECSPDADIDGWGDLGRVLRDCFREFGA
jgi:hypothetical protein